ncbi:MAG: tetratricopeptide repeat protein [Deltaproteobacteria bacterium]|nr:tetratricopeptide repeat protein [Deltaproteobacteria bacterium]
MSDTDLGFDLSFVKDIPDEEYEQMIAAIQKGAETPAEVFGLDNAALNNIERIAIALYRGQKYSQAAAVYLFILRMSPKRSSAWRGLGACTYSQKNLHAALLAYTSAVTFNPDDVIAMVYLGEVHCELGQHDLGVEALKTADAIGGKDPKYKRFLMRARAIIAANGNIPKQVILSPKAYKKAQAEVVAAGIEPEKYEYNAEEQLTIKQMRKHPQLAPLIKDLDKLRNASRIDLAEIAGFNKNELDGAYAAAVKLLETGQIVESLNLTGHLLLIHPYQPRYYQLAAIGFQRLKQYEVALEYYDLTLALDKEDARSMVFSGECHIYCGRIDKGLQDIRQGLKVAEAIPKHKDMVKHAKILLQKFDRKTTA